MEFSNQGIILKGFILKTVIIFILFLLIPSLKSLSAATNDYYPDGSWRTSSPEAQGMDSDLLYEVVNTIQVRKLNIHSFLVIRHGYLVEEAYFYPYNKNVLHVINSCTKSFTSALVGIALDKGFLKNLNQKVVDFFPEIKITNLNKRKKAMTIENLLTMTSGLDWNETNIRHDVFKDSLYQLFISDNPIRFILNVPMKSEPGTEWIYSTGVSHLLSGIVQKSSKMKGKDFARQYLFQPLGINNYYWERDPEDYLIGGGGLNLTPRDMAKFGYLYLKKGKWGNRQVLPESWVEASSTAHYKFSQAPEPWDLMVNGYGYQFRTYEFGGFAARGFAGQYIFVLPDQDMVVVFSSDLTLLNDFMAPAFFVRDLVLKSVVSNEALPEKPESFSNHLKLLEDLAMKPGK